ncbi:FHA domain-containing protein [Planctomycetales bacterium 10988]|nr:FHA domain-containing protein [Planctomycetales bacterium 10988]
MQLRLRVSSGPQAGQVVKIPQDRFLIGRAEDCHLRPNSEQVSRHHCVIMREAGEVLIRDLGSKNGTLLNGSKLFGESDLQQGDEVQIGPLSFEILLTTDVQGEKKPKVKSVAEAAMRTVTQAAESRNHEDRDLSDWLADEQEAAETISAEDTAVLRGSKIETAIMDPDITEELDRQEQKQKETSALEAAPEKKDERRIYRPSPKKRSLGSGSSRSSTSAADEALRKLMGGR